VPQVTRETPHKRSARSRPRSYRVPSGAFTMGNLRAVRVLLNFAGTAPFNFFLNGNLRRRNRGGRGGDRTPGLIVANDALSQLSYTPTVRIILANARSATKRDSNLDCHAERTFFACAITSAAFGASATLPCAKSCAPPPLPPNCFSVSRSNAPMSYLNPFVCANTT
jgi:hypothetical protein